MLELYLERLLPTALAILLLAVPSRVSAAQSDVVSTSNEVNSTLAGNSANNRFYVGAGLAPSALFLGNGSLHGWRFDAHLGYGYRAVRGLELGADVAVYPENLVLLPTAYARPYIPMAGDRLELGFIARAGLFMVPNTYSKVGGSVGLGLDARLWLAEDVALQLTTQAVAAKGPRREIAIQEDSGQVGFLALDASLAAVLRF